MVNMKMTKAGVRTFNYFGDGFEVSLELDGFRVLYAWCDNELVSREIAKGWIQGDSIEHLVNEFSYEADIEDDPKELMRTDTKFKPISRQACEAIIHASLIWTGEDETNYPELKRMRTLAGSFLDDYRKVESDAN